jgi:integrase
MSRKQPVTPAYRLHKPSGQAVVTLNAKDHYLGKFGTPESHALYDQLIARWLANGRQLPPDPVSPVTPIVAVAPASLQPAVAQAASATVVAEEGPTVNEVVLAYLRHAREYYKDSPPEQDKIKLSVRPLKQLYGRQPARSFDVLALEAVRDEMIKTLARTTANIRIGVIKRLFKWAASKKLVPAAVALELRMLAGLKRGRCNARETEPVKPVDLSLVEATLPHLNRQLRTLVSLQRITGARSGELVIMRPCDIDRSQSPWIYRPHKHKNLYRGHSREIYLGPQAQALIEPFLDRPAESYMFSPREAVAEFRAARKAARKCKVYPWEANRKRKANPKRRAGLRYTVDRYRKAIIKTCEKKKLTPWHPHQLRHTVATEIRRKYGIETARIILGHKSLQATEIYAEGNRDAAKKVMGEIG